MSKFLINNKYFLFNIIYFLVFAWIIFKPIQLININLYAPIYFLSLFSVVWFFYYSIYKKDNYIIKIFIICSVLTILTVVSYFISDVFDRRILTNWPAWFCVVLLGYFLSEKSRFSSKNTYVLAIIFLCFQSGMALLQLFEPNAFDALWPSDKTRGLNSIVRVTGSMYNPNFFAAVITLLVAFIVARTEPAKEWKWVLLGGVLILLSGSRTFIIGYPLVISAFYYLTSDGIEKYSKALYSLVILYGFTFILLFILKDTLIYSSKLLSFLFENSSVNDLNNIATFSSRTIIWDLVIHRFNSGSIGNMIIGSHNAILNPHNSYLYVLYKYGFLGLFLVGYLFWFCLRISYFAKETYEGKLLFMVTLTIVGFGFTDISSVTMTFGIYLALVLGATLYRVNCLKTVS